MRHYKVKVLQKQEIEDVITTILGLFPDRCTSIIETPKRKSERNMPNPGIVWEDGKVKIEPGVCLNEVMQNINHEPSLNVRLTRYYPN